MSVFVNTCRPSPTIAYSPDPNATGGLVIHFDRNPQRFVRRWDLRGYLFPCSLDRMIRILKGVR